MHFNGETGIERAVREALERLGIFFRQEYHVHPFYVDFFLPLMNVALEVDGLYWHQRAAQQQCDQRKEAALAARGIRTVRITDREIAATSDLGKLIKRKPHR